MATKISELKEKGNIVELVRITETNPDWMIRLDAAEALAELHDPQGLSYLNTSLNHPDPEIREVAAEILTGLGISTNASVEQSGPAVSVSTISENRFSKIAIVGINILFLIGVLPAGYLAVAVAALWNDNLVIYYCFGIPIIMCCAAVTALVLNQRGNRKLAWRFTALPLAYLFLSLLIPGIWWPWGPH